MQAKAKLQLVAPTHQNRTMPLRPVNTDLRKREYLTKSRSSSRPPARAARPMLRASAMPPSV